MTFSTQAVVTASDWPSIAEMVKKYSPSTSKRLASRRTDFPMPILTPEQLEEAFENPVEFVKHSTAATAKRQAILKELIAKRALINSQLEMLQDAMNKIANAKGEEQQQAESMRPEVEEQFKFLKSQLKILDEQEVILQKWLEQDLAELLEKHDKEWQEHNQKYGKMLIESLDKKCGIKLSESEKQEIFSPTKTKKEIIADLKKANIKLPKGFEDE